MSAPLSLKPRSAVSVSSLFNLSVFSLGVFSLGVFSLSLTTPSVSSAAPRDVVLAQQSCSPHEARDFTLAVEQALPSVVSVAAGRRDTRGKFTPQQTGTGVLWSSGLILTNTHVIKGQPEVRARTYERRVVLLRELARYEPLDISLLVAQTDGALQAQAIQRASVTPRPGAWVAAIGHPYDMHNSVTVGVVSALERDLDLPSWRGRFPGFIQSDLPLNLGNSGGPLINPCGELIGLNTAVLGAAQGLSLSLPLSRLEPVIERLLSQGHFERSYVGLTLKYVSAQRGRAAGVPPRVGVRVKAVTEGAPGALAGLQPNDIILSADEQPFSSETELSWRLISTPSGRPIRLEVARPPSQGSLHPQRLTLTLTPWSQAERAQRAPKRAP